MPSRRRGSDQNKLVYFHSKLCIFVCVTFKCLVYSSIRREKKQHLKIFTLSDLLLLSAALTWSFSDVDNSTSGLIVSSVLHLSLFFFHRKKDKNQNFATKVTRKNLLLSLIYLFFSNKHQGNKNSLV